MSDSEERWSQADPYYFRELSNLKQQRKNLDKSIESLLEEIKKSHYANNNGVLLRELDPRYEEFLKNPPSASELLDDPSLDPRFGNDKAGKMSKEAGL